MRRRSAGRRSGVPPAGQPGRRRVRRSPCPRPMTPSDTKASSSGPIDAVDRDSSAGIVSCWNAPAGMGSIGLGAREPARPGSATRARAAVSTDPTTNLGGRTRCRPYPGWLSRARRVVTRSVWRRLLASYSSARSSRRDGSLRATSTLVSLRPGPDRTSLVEHPGVAAQRPRSRTGRAGPSGATPTRRFRPRSCGRAAPSRSRS